MILKSYLNTSTALVIFLTGITGILPNRVALTKTMQAEVDCKDSYVATLFDEVKKLEHAVKNMLDSITNVDEQVGVLFALIYDVLSKRLSILIIERVKLAMIGRFGHTKDKNDVLLHSVILEVLIRLLAATIKDDSSVLECTCGVVLGWMNRIKPSYGPEGYLATIKAGQSETVVRCAAIQWLSVVRFLLKFENHLSNLIETGKQILHKLHKELQERRLSFAMLGRKNLRKDGNHVELPIEVIDTILRNLAD